MNLNDLKQQQKKSTDQLNTLLAGAQTDETRAEFDRIFAEAETRKADIARFEAMETISRTGPATSVPKDGETRKVDEFSPFGLTREQRMADFHTRTTGEETQGLSVGRAIKGLLSGSWKGAEAEQRVMASNVGTSGGFFIPGAVSASVIDLARNQSAMVAAGALTMPMAGPNITVVRVLSDPTAAWRGEGQTITESGASFGALTLAAHSLAVLVRVNNELLDDVPTFAALLDAQIAAGLALEMDRVGLYGNGVGMPLGLRNLDDVQEESMGNNGAALADYDKFLDLMQKVEEANGTATSLIWAPRSKNKAAKLVTGIASDKTKLTPPASFTALNKVTSNQVSVTETQGSSDVASTVFMGGFTNVAFAIRQGITIEATRVASDTFGKNQTLVRGIMRCDVATFRPSHLGRLVGVL